MPGIAVSDLCGWFHWSFSKSPWGLYHRYKWGNWGTAGLACWPVFRCRTLSLCIACRTLHLWVSPRNPQRRGSRPPDVEKINSGDSRAGGNDEIKILRWALTAWVQTPNQPRNSCSYSFLPATMTNDQRRSGLKERKCIILQFWSSKIEVSAGLHFFWRLEKRICPLPFLPASPGLWPIPPVTPASASVDTPILLPPFWLHHTCLSNPRYSLHLRILNLITLAKSLCHEGDTFTGSGD